MSKLGDQYINKAKNLILKIVNNRGKLSQEQVEDIRLDIGAISFLLVEEVMHQAFNDASYAEMDYDDIYTKEFGRLYKEYCNTIDEDTNKNKYTRSSAETFARNTSKLKKLKIDGKIVVAPTHKANLKKEETKNYQKMLYQLLKSIDRVSNSLAAISKRTI